jgi:hypothetical protein
MAQPKIYSKKNLKSRGFSVQIDFSEFMENLTDNIAIALLLLAIFPQAPWLGWVVVFNTAGAVGDLWIATLLLRCPSSITVEDRKAGVAIYAPPHLDSRSLPFRKRRGKAKSVLWDMLNAIASVVAALIAVSFLLPVFFDILQVPSFAIGTNNWWIVRWENNPKGFNLALGLFSPTSDRDRTRAFRTFGKVTRRSPSIKSS